MKRLELRYKIVITRNETPGDEISKGDLKKADKELMKTLIEIQQALKTLNPDYSISIYPIVAKNLLF